MRLTLNEEEICAAVTEYLNNRGIVVESANVEIDLDDELASVVVEVQSLPSGKPEPK